MITIRHSILFAWVIILLAELSSAQKSQSLTEETMFIPRFFDEGHRRLSTKFARLQALDSSDIKDAERVTAIRSLLQQMEQKMSTAGILRFGRRRRSSDVTPNHPVYPRRVRYFHQTTTDESRRTPPQITTKIVKIWKTYDTSSSLISE